MFTLYISSQGSIPAGTMQDRLVEQARVAETEIHGLFEFRKDTIPKLQEHLATQKIELKATIRCI